jgi:hypothetical protein
VASSDERTSLLHYEINYSFRGTRIYIHVNICVCERERESLYDCVEVYVCGGVSMDVVTCK